MSHAPYLPPKPPPDASAARAAALAQGARRRRTARQAILSAAGIWLLLGVLFGILAGAGLTNIRLPALLLTASAGVALAALQWLSLPLLARRGSAGVWRLMRTTLPWSHALVGIALIWLDHLSLASLYGITAGLLALLAYYGLSNGFGSTLLFGVAIMGVIELLRLAAMPDSTQPEYPAFVLLWLASVVTMAIVNGRALAQKRQILQLYRQQREQNALIREKNSVLDRQGWELIAMNRRLQQISLVDGLTELANRRHFDEVLLREWGRAAQDWRRGGLAGRSTTLALLMLDIDHFKRYNDRFGHQAGDQCLQTVAAAIGSSLHRRTDLAARYGGEEFAVLLPDSDLAGARRIAEEILAGVTAATRRNAQLPESVTVSIGITRCLGSQDSRRALIERADQALYAAKAAGRGRVQIAPEPTPAIATAQS